MPYKDLREFIATLESAGELVRIKAEVNPELEITEITDRVCKAGGPALLFENPRGSLFPVLINAFGSEKRMALSLGVKDTREIGEQIVSLLKHTPPVNFADKLKSLPTILELSKIIPKTVSKGVCKEVILKGDDINLLKFPVLKCWPEDSGRFITFPCVFTKNPETGIRNCGMYRMQVYDAKTTGMHWHTHHQGADHYRSSERAGNEKIEAAVSLGGDPVITFAATAPVPDNVDEMLFAGFIRRKAVEMVKCETVDLEVPADSEIVIEGYVNAGELRREGPFGDHTGYYSLADDYPVFHITCITHRKDAVYPATVVGRPPMEDTYMGIATGHIFLPLLRLQMPEIVNMNLPMEGVFHNMLFVSIDKKYPMHARKVMNYVWGAGQMMFTKMIVVVDKDVDVFNTSDVLFRIGNNVDWERDIMISRGPVDALDHASPMPHWGGKIGIDATKKLPEEGHTRPWPSDITMQEDIKKMVTARWKEYGIKL
ncbi:MAG: menaquinone biosynthesis decarboxylase [Deferribacteraceae bacterium]|jgi:4-hydroxy-3-polyprenylbenzoate decarboxylase|nr:menaquinone biosynthesis decarboxylase [Deferribacteraceae bacterium]